MDLSSQADWLGVITGVAVVSTWGWKSLTWARSRIAAVRQDADCGRALASELVSKATNAERRADIHSFICLRAIEAQGRRTRSTVFLAASFAGTIPTLLFSVIYLRTIAALSTWSIIILSTSVATIFISLAAVMVTGHVLNQLEDGWQSGVDSALQIKLDKHVA